MIAHEPPRFPLMAGTELEPALNEAQRRSEPVVGLSDRAEHERAARLFAATIAFGPGEWDQQLTEEMREVFIAHAPTFLDEARGPNAVQIDLPALPWAFPHPCSARGRLCATSVPGQNRRRTAAYPLSEGVQMSRDEIRSQRASERFLSRPDGRSASHAAEDDRRSREVARAPSWGAAAARPVVIVGAGLLAALLATLFPLSPGYSFADTTADVVAPLVVGTAAVGPVWLAATVRGWSVVGRWRLDGLVLFAAALLSAGAAAIHFAVIKMHFDEYILFGLFFIGTGTAQLVWSLWLVLRPSRWLLRLGAGGNLLITALWTVDRIWGLPIGPEHWKPDPVGFADSVASGFELVLALSSLALLSPAARRSLQQRQTPPNTGSALAFLVVALTALSLLSLVGVAPSILAPAA